MPNRFNSYDQPTLLERLRWRKRVGGLEGLGGGSGGATPVAEPDVEPANNGPDRDYASLANATIDEPVNQPANPGGTAASPTAVPGRVPADPNQRAGVVAPVAAAPAAPAAEWQSIRDAAAAQGFRFDGTVTDDRTALNFLLAQAQRGQQENVYAQLGKQLAPRSGAIQQFLSQQTQPQPAAPPRQPWEAPEFDERWAGLVDQDQATGLYTSKPGVPHEIASKVNAFVEWKKGYDRNPAGVINGMVEARAKAISQETFKEQFAAQAREQQISSIVQGNAHWMYQVDPSGQPTRDFRGQFIATPVGAAYMQQLQAVQRMGVTDPRQQDELAKNLVRGQYALAAQQQAWAAQQQAGNPAVAAAAHQPNVNPLQAAPPSTRRANPAATEPDQTGLSLSERLRAALAADGVTDTDIYNSGN